tara:strand:+ start:9651 stop:9845 length:195 start_codon:yes stop_codon:yes gene_type:complete
MNKKKSYIIIAVASLAIVHLITSYIMWDINPGNWSSTARGGAGVGMILALVLNVVGIAEQNQYK